MEDPVQDHVLHLVNVSLEPVTVLYLLVFYDIDILKAGKPDTLYHVHQWSVWLSLIVLHDPVHVLQSQ